MEAAEVLPAERDLLQKVPIPTADTAETHFDSIRTKLERSQSQRFKIGRMGNLT
jgi:hypothetical protein